MEKKETIIDADIQHIFDSGANELRVQELLERRTKAAYNKGVSDGMRQAENDLEDDFIPCSDCDGHDACRDFGCAIESGLGHLVKNDDF